MVFKALARGEMVLAGRHAQGKMALVTLPEGKEAGVQLRPFVSSLWTILTLLELEQPDGPSPKSLDQCQSHRSVTCACAVTSPP